MQYYTDAISRKKEQELNAALEAFLAQGGHIKDLDAEERQRIEQDVYGRVADTLRRNGSISHKSIEVMADSPVKTSTVVDHMRDYGLRVVMRNKIWLNLNHSMHKTRPENKT